MGIQSLFRNDTSYDRWERNGYLNSSGIISFAQISKKGNERFQREIFIKLGTLPIKELASFLSNMEPKAAAWVLCEMFKRNAALQKDARGQETPQRINLLNRIKMALNELPDRLPGKSADSHQENILKELKTLNDESREYTQLLRKDLEETAADFVRGREQAIRPGTTSVSSSVRADLMLKNLLINTTKETEEFTSYLNPAKEPGLIEVKTTYGKTNIQEIEPWEDVIVFRTEKVRSQKIGGKIILTNRVNPYDFFTELRIRDSECWGKLLLVSSKTPSYWNKDLTVNEKNLNLRPQIYGGRVAEKNMDDVFRGPYDQGVIIDLKYLGSILSGKIVGDPDIGSVEQRKATAAFLLNRLGPNGALRQLFENKDDPRLDELRKNEKAWDLIESIYNKIPNISGDDFDMSEEQATELARGIVFLYKAQMNIPIMESTIQVNSYETVFDQSIKEIQEEISNYDLLLGQGKVSLATIEQKISTLRSEAENRIKNSGNTVQEKVLTEKINKALKALESIWAFKRNFSNYYKQIKTLLVEGVKDNDPLKVGYVWESGRLTSIVQLYQEWKQRSGNQNRNAGDFIKDDTFWQSRNLSQQKNALFNSALFKYILISEIYKPVKGYVSGERMGFSNPDTITDIQSDVTLISREEMARLQNYVISETSGHSLGYQLLSVGRNFLQKINPVSQNVKALKDLNLDAVTLDGIPKEKIENAKNISESSQSQLASIMDRIMNPSGSDTSLALPNTSSAEEKKYTATQSLSEAMRVSTVQRAKEIRDALSSNATLQQDLEETRAALWKNIVATNGNVGAFKDQIQYGFIPPNLGSNEIREPEVIRPIGSNDLGETADYYSNLVKNHQKLFDLYLKARDSFIADTDLDQLAQDCPNLSRSSIENFREQNKKNLSAVQRQAALAEIFKDYILTPAEYAKAIQNYYLEKYPDQPGKNTSAKVEAARRNAKALIVLYNTAHETLRSLQSASKIIKVDPSAPKTIDEQMRINEMRVALAKKVCAIENDYINRIVSIQNLITDIQNLSQDYRHGTWNKKQEVFQALQEKMEALGTAIKKLRSDYQLNDLKNQLKPLLQEGNIDISNELDDYARVFQEIQKGPELFDDHLQNLFTQNFKPIADFHYFYKTDKEIYLQVINSIPTRNNGHSQALSDVSNQIGQIKDRNADHYTATLKNLTEKLFPENKRAGMNSTKNFDALISGRIENGYKRVIALVEDINKRAPDVQAVAKANLGILQAYPQTMGRLSRLGLTPKELDPEATLRYNSIKNRHWASVEQVTTDEAAINKTLEEQQTFSEKSFEGFNLADDINGMGTLRDFYRVPTQNSIILEVEGQKSKFQEVMQGEVLTGLGNATQLRIGGSAFGFNPDVNPIGVQESLSHLQQGLREGTLVYQNGALAINNQSDNQVKEKGFEVFTQVQHDFGKFKNWNVLGRMGLEWTHREIRPGGTSDVSLERSTSTVTNIDFGNIQFKNASNGGSNYLYTESADVTGLNVPVTITFPNGSSVNLTPPGGSFQVTAARFPATAPSSPGTNVVNFTLTLQAQGYTTTVPAVLTWPFGGVATISLNSPGNISIPTTSTSFTGQTVYRMQKTIQDQFTVSLGANASTETKYGKFIFDVMVGLSTERNVTEDRLYQVINRASLVNQLDRSEINYLTGVLRGMLAYQSPDMDLGSTLGIWKITGGVVWVKSSVLGANSKRTHVSTASENLVDNYVKEQTIRSNDQGQGNSSIGGSLSLEKPETSILFLKNIFARFILTAQQSTYANAFARDQRYQELYQKNYGAAIEIGKRDPEGFNDLWSFRVGVSGSSREQVFDGRHQRHSESARVEVGGSFALDDRTSINVNASFSKGQESRVSAEFRTRLGEDANSKPIPRDVRAAKAIQNKRKAEINDALVTLLSELQIKVSAQPEALFDLLVNDEGFRKRITDAAQKAFDPSNTEARSRSFSTLHIFNTRYQAARNALEKVVRSLGGYADVGKTEEKYPEIRKNLESLLTYGSYENEIISLLGDLGNELGIPAFGLERLENPAFCAQLKNKIQGTFDGSERKSQMLQLIKLTGRLASQLRQMEPHEKYGMAIILFQESYELMLKKRPELTGEL